MERNGDNEKNFILYDKFLFEAEFLIAYIAIHVGIVKAGLEVITYNSPSKNQNLVV